MKLNYYLLWVEDDDSWFKDTSELFEMTINDYGFNTIIERKKTLSEVKEEIAKDNLKKFDVFLIDFNLKDSENGDSIIELLRGKEIYTDIVFYSSDKGSIIESVKEHQFEGVYHSDRREIQDKFEKVFKTTIKKVEEINSMRGLIVGETSELDALIEEHLLVFIKSPYIDKFDCDKFVKDEIFDSTEKRNQKLKQTYNQGGIEAIFKSFDAIKKWKLLRAILKKNSDKNKYFPEFIEINKNYNTEVIDIRNKFAHAQVMVLENGSEVLKSQFGDNHFEFDEESFKKIREDLINHRSALLKLKE
ncbi:hypothetical protein FCOL_07575 [Flavobacterium columnare ATCC 49512]|uniref:Response regulator n=1 Tax=Flavobacterium columnare (strain ATCC 49512 / CIP 103533 / TG 44/87) TaxID=1041826 RepID=G8X6X3_FLACA|nr:hypothetical protein [Flavobacterium columnare]AEW86334.1 hypothetical protein FCOL_07575 [Flavobacterium columnare ATCC 49512]